MNSSDWVTATGGSTLVGLGGGFRRPLNPKLLPHLVTKAPSSKSAASARQTRRMVLRVAQLTGEVDDMLPPTVSRRRARVVSPYSPSIEAQSQPGHAGSLARLRHAASVQRYRKPF